MNEPGLISEADQLFAEMPCQVCGGTEFTAQGPPRVADNFLRTVERVAEDVTCNSCGGRFKRIFLRYIGDET